MHYVIRGEVYGATTLRSDPTLVEGVRVSLKQFERDTRDAVAEMSTTARNDVGQTSIEWTDFSINPIRARDRATGKHVGHWCEKISPGCKFCYASRMQNRFGMFEFVASNAAKVEPFFDADVLQQVLRRRKPTKWFWCDMTDMFGGWVADVTIDECFSVMGATEQHIHQVLTKRPERMLDYVTRFGHKAWNSRRLETEAYPPRNVWLGVSVEDRKHGLPRIDVLRQVPAAVRFLSIEPLLEDLGQIDLTGIHWVIVGGESGYGARRFDVAWVYPLIDQCAAAGIPCFVKQLGGNAVDCGGRYSANNWPWRKRPTAPYELERINLRDKKGGDWSEWPEDLRVRDFPQPLIREPRA